MLPGRRSQPRRATTSMTGTVHHTGSRPIRRQRLLLPRDRSGAAMLGVAVTSRTRAEREARFQARLLESVRDAIVVVDTRGRFTYWNKGAEEMFGATADEMLGRELLDLLSDDTKDQVEGLWRAVGQGETDLGEWQNSRPDGTKVWLNARMSPIMGEGGSPEGFLAIIKDVTARRQSELELRRLGLAIDRANDAVIVTDDDDRVTYVNPAFERMTGYAAAE